MGRSVGEEVRAGECSISAYGRIQIVSEVLGDGG